MENKEPIKIRLSSVILIFIIIILLVVIAFMYVFYNKKDNTTTGNTSLNNSQNNLETEITEKNNVENNTSNNSTENIEEIDINSDIVQQLYKYILKDNECIEEIAYQNQKVTSSNLSNKAKLMTIFENIDNSKADDVKKGNNGETHYYFNKDTIEKEAKKIFGDNIQIAHESLENLLGKTIKFSNGVYDKYDVQGGGGFLWENSTQYLAKAEKNNDEIYLYDKYVHVVTSEDDYGKYDIYNASDRKIKLGENISSADIYKNAEDYTNAKNYIQNIEKVTNKKVNTFKHTFKKNTDGNYYWVSTEISNDDN